MKKVNKYSGRKLKKPNMKQEGNFTQIPNAFILNPEIRDPELRLLLYIMMHSDNRTITTKNCILYLCKTKPAIGSSFEKLIASGILKISDENIEIQIPEELKKYKLGYLESKENITTEVNKTLPSDSENPIEKGKENLTTEVKRTLLSGKENITPKVKNSYKKPLKYIDNEYITNPVILNNNRVLPVPAASGSTEQSHSNGNTKVKIGDGLNLEGVSLTSARIPSGVPQTQNLPIGMDGKLGKESLPIVGKNFDTIPNEDNNFNTLSSNHFQNEPENHTAITEINDLDLVLENIPYFKIMYDNAKWGEINISNFSNAYISHLMIEMEKKNGDERISPKTYFFISRLINYSSLLGEKSNLWMEFQRQCKSEKRTDIISKYSHNSIKTQNHI